MGGHSGSDSEESEDFDELEELLTPSQKQRRLTSSKGAGSDSVIDPSLALIKAPGAARTHTGRSDAHNGIHIQP
jgi:hypothetical protein